MENGKNIAVVLAAGTGSRMHSHTPKQYLPLDGKPLVCHSLDVMEGCPFMDGIVLVVGKGEVAYAEAEIKEHYSYRKIRRIVEGGAERYFSVANALEEIASQLPECGYVYIHDGARPYLGQEVLERLRAGVEKNRACIAAMPVKDTIKIVGKDGRIKETPDRSTLWAAQTPQAFRFSLILEAYRALLRERQIEGITDDAQVLERMFGIPSQVAEGSYRNIKITTPEDLPAVFF